MVPLNRQKIIKSKLELQQAKNYQGKVLEDHLEFLLNYILHKHIELLVYHNLLDTMLQIHLFNNEKFNILPKRQPSTGEVMLTIEKTVFTRILS